MYVHQQTETSLVYTNRSQTFIIQYTKIKQLFNKRFFFSRSDFHYQFRGITQLNRCSSLKVNRLVFPEVFFFSVLYNFDRAIRMLTKKNFIVSHWP